MTLPHELPDQAARRHEDYSIRPGGIILNGYLRKLKGLKKKYFVLYIESKEHPARLEYFDSEKKWKHDPKSPKKSICVKSCFNINKRSDCKHKNVIALYTKDDCFSIAFDSEEELQRWLIALLNIQLGDTLTEGEELKPIFEHVWQVTVQNKELGARENIVGAHRLCLTTRVLTLVKMPLLEPAVMWEFPLMNIRRCGYSNGLFFMELGRGSVTGAGELWMGSGETSIAQSMHSVILDAMRNCAKEDHGPRPRTRSSSVNERPATLPSWTPSSSSSTSSVLRNRADSVPSRSRTTSETMIVTPPDPAEMGRPSSICLPESSFSPPVSISSPNSYLHANDSMASSFSTDDFDNHLGIHVVDGFVGRNRYSHAATPENSLPKESTILEEERVDDYLSMRYEASPGTRSMASSSLGRSVSLSSARGTKTRTPPIKPPLHQNPYMDMTSPSWSPPSVPDGYMPMLPGTTGSGPGSVVGGGTRSGTHTRSSSFCEDAAESYIPMAPQSVAGSSVTSREDDTSSYMDMQCRRSVPREVHGGGRGRLSPASCSSLASSMTSGTTSVPYGTPPVRFHEYHLEKVTSMLTPSEDDDELSSLRCRQSRAYSVGSRPDARRKFSTTSSAAKIEPVLAAVASASADSARVRAYSVGSRINNSAGSGVTHQLSTSNDSSVCSSRNNMDSSVAGDSTSGGGGGGGGGQTDDVQRKKSLSVPVLGGIASPVPNSWTNPTGTFLRTMMGHQASGRRENDLMEIEFGADHPTNKDNYISCDSLGSISTVDQVDGRDPPTDLSKLGLFGSSDSVGRGSLTSTNSGSGFPRTVSRSSSVLSSRGNGKSGKSESFRGARERKSIRPELDRLESVPQGKDQDYIEYGENKAAKDLAAAAGGIQRSTRSSFPTKADQRNKSVDEEDSADEYVELAKPPSSRSRLPRVSVTETGDFSAISSAKSPVNEYLAMDYGKPRSVPCQITQEANNLPSTGYMDMSYSSTKSVGSAQSHPASVSDSEGYLPMDYTPKSSRNVSRQSSQVDLVLAAGTFSPCKASQTMFRSDSMSSSGRQSRGAEVSDLPTDSYMEMTFNHSESSHSLRSDKSVRTRIPSPYGKSESEASGALADSETNITATASAATPSKTSSKASSFFSNFLSRKPSGAGSPGDGGTLPRSSRSMPVSPFSSLKRPKSYKKRRSTTTTAVVPSSPSSMSPVSPDVDLSATFYQERPGLTLRSNSIPSRNSFHSPMTPPSPAADFGRLLPQFSPPLGSSPSSRISGTQPISISAHRAVLQTPRGSPAAAESFRSAMTSAELSDYVLPAGIGRYSTSPGRLGVNSSVTMPTLSPLPEVLFNPAKIPDKKNNGGDNSSSYMNMDYSGTPSKKFTFDVGPNSQPLPSPGIEPIPEHSEKEKAPPTPSSHYKSANESNRLKLTEYVPVSPAAAESKPPEAPRTLPAAPPLKSDPNRPSKPTKPTTPAPAPPLTRQTSTPTPLTVISIPTSATPTPTKQRANSLEKIVGAFDKVRIGPKRHSSGDKPKRSGGAIFRSNSYQPSGSRVVVAGSKPTSTSILTDIFAGKVLSSLTSQSPGSAKSVKSPHHPALGSNRTSSTSLASLGEDPVTTAEMQAVPWNATTPLDGALPSGNAFQPLSSLSPGLASSSSPSPSLTLSRPTSVLSEKELYYAQLDLTPCTTPFRPEDCDSAPRSPRNSKAPLSVFADAEAPTTYAQIDFLKSEGHKV